MAGFLIAIAVSAIVLAALTVLALAGFRNGDYTGEALARALRKDLEAGATQNDRIPPPR
ncbi:MAG: hypothetical protein ACRDNO_02735 [Trebonia sp.]